jgi:hypothetical protein
MKFPFYYLKIVFRVIVITGIVFVLTNLKNTEIYTLNCHSLDSHLLVTPPFYFIKLSESNSENINNFTVFLNVESRESERNIDNSVILSFNLSDSFSDYISVPIPRATPVQLVCSSSVDVKLTISHLTCFGYTGVFLWFIWFIFFVTYTISVGSSLAKKTSTSSKRGLIIILGFLIVLCAFSTVSVFFGTQSYGHSGASLLNFRSSTNIFKLSIGFCRRLLVSIELFIQEGLLGNFIKLISFMEIPSLAWFFSPLMYGKEYSSLPYSHSFSNVLVFFSFVFLVLGGSIAITGIHLHRLFLIALYFFVTISTGFRLFEVLRNFAVSILEFLALRSISDYGPGLLFIFSLVLFVLFLIVAVSVVVPAFFKKSSPPTGGAPRNYQDVCIDLASGIPSRWTLFSLYFSGIFFFIYFFIYLFISR